MTVALTFARPLQHGSDLFDALAAYLGGVERAMHFGVGGVEYVAVMTEGEALRVVRVERQVGGWAVFEVDAATAAGLMAMLGDAS
jgi:hypothetical protein